MKPITPGQRFYWNERCEAENSAHQLSSFTHILGKQSIHIGNMIKCRHQNSFKGVYDNWEKLEHLNNKWANLVMVPFRSSPNMSQEQLNRLHQVALDMARGYTSTIVELVLNGHVKPEKLQSVIGAEAKFFSVVLGNSHGYKDNAESETRKHWARHTDSILNIMQSIHPNPTYDDENFHYAAGNCIIHGKLLGTWLDAIFLNK